MSRITYVMTRIGKMDFSRMRDTAKMLHKKTGKPTAWLLADIFLIPAFLYCLRQLQRPHPHDRG